MFNENQFREDVIKHLENQRQIDRFIAGREKYKNDPRTIDYDEEIRQELDDVSIYGTMQFVIESYENEE